jgi:hypothetical protein
MPVELPPPTEVVADRVEGAAAPLEAPAS